MEQRKPPSKRLEALPVLTVSSKRAEARRIAVQQGSEFFSLTDLFRKHWIWKEGMTLIFGISTDYFNNALHQALWERINEKCLSGSAPNRLEAHGANRDPPKRVVLYNCVESDCRFS